MHQIFPAVMKILSKKTKQKPKQKPVVACNGSQHCQN